MYKQKYGYRGPNTSTKQNMVRCFLYYVIFFALFIFFINKKYHRKTLVMNISACCSCHKILMIKKIILNNKKKCAENIFCTEKREKRICATCNLHVCMSELLAMWNCSGIHVESIEMLFDVWNRENCVRYFHCYLQKSYQLDFCPYSHISAGVNCFCSLHQLC